MPHVRKTSRQRAPRPFLGPAFPTTERDPQQRPPRLQRYGFCLNDLAPAHARYAGCDSCSWGQGLQPDRGTHFRAKLKGPRMLTDLRYAFRGLQENPTFAAGCTGRPDGSAAL